MKVENIDDRIMFSVWYQIGLIFVKGLYYLTNDLKLPCKLKSKMSFIKIKTCLTRSSWDSIISKHFRKYKKYNVFVLNSTAANKLAIKAPFIETINCYKLRKLFIVMRRSTFSVNLTYFIDFEKLCQDPDHYFNKESLINQ